MSADTSWCRRRRLFRIVPALRLTRRPSLCPRPQVKELKKKADKEREAAALVQAKAVSAAAAPGALVVQRIDFGADGKLASKLGKELDKGAKTSSFAVFSALDGDDGKFACFAFVCKAHLDEGLDAKQLVDAVLAAAGGGKSGGRPASANGTTEAGKLGELDAAMAAASAFSWK